MKLLTKVSAGLLLSFSSILLMHVTVEALSTKNHQATQEQKQEMADRAFAGLALGLSGVGLGSSLMLSLKKQHQRQLTSHLQSTFYRLVEEQKGEISLLRFAKEAEITGEEAKLFLDSKAQEFNATFDHSQNGGVYYHFHL
ncbi:hypothetical protein [Calothrix sp. CCY 0018]|uniref:hypothetical protein n=1 Tax=Calothrix sp. CCY 0018 TaxID=3103864 RepID=UPI0039C6A0DD